MKTKQLVTLTIGVLCLLSVLKANKNVKTTLLQTPGKINSNYSFSILPKDKNNNQFDERQSDSLASDQLVYLSNDNTFIVMESSLPKDNGALILEVTRPTIFEGKNSDFPKVNFHVFNNQLNTSKGNDIIKAQRFFISLKSKENNDIYESSYNGKNWSTPKKLDGLINSGYNETSACLSSDGNTLYFTSDRPGGYGGMDIYQSELMDNGNWGPAINLGVGVNTSKDEESPFILADNATMYFSSEGHHGHGGFDVFSTTQNEDGIWSLPTNAGASVNTQEDELYFKITGDEKSAFYSSSIDRGNGNYKILKIQFDPNSVVQK